MRASLVQQRIDEGTDHIDIRLTNRGRTAVRIREVQIRWSGVSRSPPARGADYDPGRTIDLQTAYGRAVCAPEPTGDVEVVVRLGDNSHLRLPVDRHGSALLRRLHDRECALQDLASVADISLSPIFERSESGLDRLQGSIVLRRTPGSRAGDRREISVEGVFGSVLLSFTYDGEGGLPQVLEAGAGVLEVPVALGSSNRCDPHALGQSTQTFLLSVYLRIDDDRPRRVILVPGRALQRQVTALIDRVCL